MARWRDERTPGTGRSSMSYALVPGERLSNGLPRVMAEEVELARAQLGSGEASPDVAVHEARKALKRVRAVLRLLREGLGEGYRAEYGFYRDAGRQLSVARDSWVIAETLRQLAVASDDASTRARLTEIASEELASGSPGLAVFESGLAARLAAELAEGRERAASLKLEGDAIAVVTASLARTYKSGRGRMREALGAAGVDTPSERWAADPMHAWRRRAKDIWYQVSIFVPAWEPVLAPLSEALSALSEALGAHHDLAVVHAALEEREPGLAGTEPVVRVFHRRMEELQETAARLGPRIYAEGPRPFARRVLSYWQIWHAETAAASRPDEMEVPA